MNIIFVVKHIDIEHLNIMQLASVLRRAGYTAEVVPLDEAAVIRRLDAAPCLFVAYSAPALLAAEYAAFHARLRRRRKVMSVFGGPHPTLFPDMIEDPGVDVVCRGEGEDAIVELADAVCNDRDITRIKNLWVKQNGRIHKNPLRPLISDLDMLPFPARDLFPQAETYTKRKMHVITSRGCPHSCAYCCHPAYDALYGGKAKTVRRRSVANVIDEIAGVADRETLKLVMFEDDLFVSDTCWTERFCREYTRRVAIPFFCYVRADTVTAELVARLKQAGCVAMSMGLETADETVRRTILHRDMSNARIRTAAGIIKKAGIRLETTNIIGIPGTTLAHDIATIRLNIACRTDYCSVKLLAPYPGTGVHAYAQTYGLLDTDVPVSSWRSAFRFSEQRRRETENMVSMFAVIAAFPVLVPAVRVLVSLHCGPLYRIIGLLWDGYVSFFRLYPTGLRGFYWGLKKFIRMFREYRCFPESTRRGHERLLCD